jgi:hypothetical protein
MIRDMLEWDDAVTAHSGQVRFLCAERFLAKPGECELPAKSTAVLALQWRRLAHQAETLDRERCCWPSRASGSGKISRCAAVLNMAGRAARTILILLKIEVPPCHFAGVISRQTSSANVRSYGVDRACRGDSYSPTSATQRPPPHRIRTRSPSTYARGIRSGSASLSNEKRGHSGANEQHAPQARHSEAVSSGDLRWQAAHLILRLIADSFPRLLSISYWTA